MSVSFIALSVCVIQPMDLAVDFKTPGADLGNILYLRNVADADKVIAALKEVKETGGKVRAHPLSTYHLISIR